MRRDVGNNYVKGNLIKDGKYWLIPIDSSEYRTLLSNKYLWYIYSIFVRSGIFDNTEIAHKELGEKYLMVRDVVGYTDFESWLNIFQSKCRTKDPIFKKEKTENEIIIHWVLSTSKLKRRKSKESTEMTFGEYVDNIKLLGYESGLTFDSFDDWVDNYDFS